eukprot:g1920.t1
MREGVEFNKRASTPGRGIKLPTLSLTSMSKDLVQGAKEADAAAAMAAVKNMVALPRGGFLVKTNAGPVQFGLPPETIKDHMAMGNSVPTIFVVPFQRFHQTMAINVAEFEFPAYFNFFVLRKRLKLICTQEGEKHVRTVFQETLLGPNFDNLVRSSSDDYASSVPMDARADLAKELKAFAINPFNKSQELSVDLLIEFLTFDAEGEFTPGDTAAAAGGGEESSAAGESSASLGGDFKVSLGAGVEIQMLVEDPATMAISYLVMQDGKEIAKVPDTVDLPKISEATRMGASLASKEAASEKLKELPLFGVTLLGTSHGFDPTGSTTGFVLWVYGRGILVDPPPNAGVLLQMMGVPSRIVDAVILTHCHADHDAGTFQKLLHEEQVTLITTQTILRSFMRKYAALAGLDENTLRRLFIFKRARIGEMVNIRGAQLRFFYALHSIPCIGFEASFRGKKVAYSADTLMDPDRIAQFHADGVLGDGRRDQLMNFPWDADIILHEAGVPPIHTPATFLASLSEDVKERLYLVHCSQKDVPRGKGLKIASEGAENTLVLHTAQQSQDETVVLLEALSSVGQLRALSMPYSQELLRIVRTVELDGDELLTEAVGDVFLIVLSGGVRVVTVEPELERGPTRASGASGSRVSRDSSDTTDFDEGGKESGSFILDMPAERPKSSEVGPGTIPNHGIDGLQSADDWTPIPIEPMGPTIEIEGRKERADSDGGDSADSFTGIAGPLRDELVLGRWEFFPPQNFWKGGLTGGGGGAKVNIQRCPVSTVHGFADGTKVAIIDLRDLNSLLKNSADSEVDFVGGLHDSDHSMQTAKEYHLESSPYLPRLGPAQRAELAEMMNLVSFDAGQNVWKRGYNAVFAFMPAVGDLEVVSGTRSSQQTIPCPKDVGLFIDESYWLGTTRYSCTLRAATNAKG